MKFQIEDNEAILKGVRKRRSEAKEILKTIRSNFKDNRREHLRQNLIETEIANEKKVIQEIKQIIRIKEIRDRYRKLSFSSKSG